MSLASVSLVIVSYETFPVPAEPPPVAPVVSVGAGVATGDGSLPLFADPLVACS